MVGKKIAQGIGCNRSHDRMARQSLVLGSTHGAEFVVPRTQALPSGGLLSQTTDETRHPGGFSIGRSRWWAMEFRRRQPQNLSNAMDQRFSLLHHSGISPLLNNGLLHPEQVLAACLKASEQQKIPLSSTEGLVRQILGWREFVHGVYMHAGIRQRNGNFWGFERPMPQAFYTATTGIEPVDHCIRGVLNNAYNHHIERLMILSNFMLLCEIQPHAVYQWFMEMYIDAYDWVMVPNVYGMGQFADGGVLSTKPYISSSNYVLKMSNYRADKAWTEPWDALYWRFISSNKAYFLRNPRSAMMVRQWEKKPAALQEQLLQNAEDFLQNLHLNKSKN
ncbi:MAG: hypothetical protein EBS08_02875 [Cytophagia bacterium]|nr:hypothetical protein [Cytophagia bacterium]